MKKMKKSFMFVAAIVLFAVSGTAIAGTVNIADGLLHTINNGTYAGDTVNLDVTAQSPATEVELVSGGDVSSLIAWNTSGIEMTGGHAGSIIAYNNSEVFVDAGTIGTNLSAYHNTYLEMTGADVGGNIYAVDNGVVSISGGSFDGFLQASSNAMIYLHGSNFQVGGVSLVSGDMLSDFGLFNGSAYTGYLTGQLEDGSYIDNDFVVYNTGTYSGTADIMVLIPEPATVLLLGLGGLLLKKRK